VQFSGGAVKSPERVSSGLPVIRPEWVFESAHRAFPSLSAIGGSLFASEETGSLSLFE
jgi:hypothetical protein